MAFDDPIEPIRPDAPPRVDPAEPPRVATPRAITPPAATPPSDVLADELQRALLTDDAIADEPHDVGQRAGIHDAAVRGEQYARAVEAAAVEADAAADARVPDPNSVEQILGGAAAAAYSGQAVRIDRTRPARDEHSERAEDLTSPLDVLAPLRGANNDDETARHRRSREQAADDDPPEDA